MRQLLLFSTSTVHGTAYMEYAIPYIDAFMGDVRSIVFVPYARPSGLSHDRYTELFRGALQPAGYDVSGLHEHDDPSAALASAESVFVGGGNTFVLLSRLYAEGVIDTIRGRVAAGMRYLGSSAGSNVAGRSIGTTNDMPIAYPASFEALQLVPFNINPHYLDPDPSSRHMGETRETRIKEFHVFNEQPVVGLREGTAIEVVGDTATLLGDTEARVFQRGEEPVERQPGDKLDDMLG